MHRAASSKTGLRVRIKISIRSLFGRGEWDRFRDDREAIALAKVPEALDEVQRQRKYDRPLAAMLSDRRVGKLLRGFSQPSDGDQPAWVGLEARFVVVQNVTAFCECLVELGAPPETRIECETRKATLDLILGDIRIG